MTIKTTERESLIEVLKTRFEEHMNRHAGTAWSDVRVRLEGHPEALKSLQAMEATRGEPDVVGDPGFASGVRSGRTGV